MLAISKIKGTKYACNLKSDTYLICLQCLSMGTIYACKAYIVPFVTKIAIIFGLNRLFHCKHIWFLSL